MWSRLKRGSRPTTKVAQLQEELQQQKESEKRLVDVNKELREKLSSLVEAETNLKKEQLEVDRLRKQISVKDSQIDRFRTNYAKVKTNFRIEEEQRVKEIKDLQESNLVLEKKLSESQKEYTSEKMLREEKDRKLDKQDNKNKENKTLTMQKQTLKTQLEDLKGKHNHAKKTIDELRQKLEDKSEEYKELLLLHNEARKSGAHNEFDNLRLRKNVNTLEHDQSEAIKKDIKLQGDMQKQTEAYRKETWKLKQENKRLEEDNTRQDKLLLEQEVKIEILTKEKRSLTAEVEKKGKKIKKQDALILKMECEVSSVEELKLKLQSREEENSRLVSNYYKENMAINNTIDLLEKRVRHGIVEIGFIQTEKNVISENLFKAQETIDSKVKLINQLTEEIQDQSDQISTNNLELENIMKKYQVRTKQWRDINRKLEETKRSMENLSAVSNKDECLLQKKLVTMAAEQDKMTKELKFCKQQLADKTQTIDNQTTEKTRQQEAAREYMEEIKSLKQENVNLRRQYDTDIKVVKQNTGNLKRPPNQTIIRTWGNEQKREHSLLLEKLELEEKKNEEERKMVVEQPVDTTQKLRQCQIDIRVVEEKYKVSQQNCEMYKEMHRCEKEQNTRLTDDLRRLKSESAERSRNICLPPISNKTPPVPMDKSKGPCETISRHTRFPPLPKKPQCLTVAESKAALSPGCQARKRVLSTNPSNLH